MKTILHHLLAIALLLLAPTVMQARTLRVFVSIEPQLESLQRIGADLVTVEALVPAGANPETYVPSPRRMTELGKADMLIRIGVPFEKALLAKIRGAFPELVIIDGTAGMAYREMEDGHHEPHGHARTQHGGDYDDHGHHHAAGDRDPHVWLSIANMRIHAKTVASVIAGKFPEQAAAIHSRCQLYDAELQQLDDVIRGMLAPLKDCSAVVFHPAFGYFLDRYGVKQQAVELGGKEPTGRHLRELIADARKHGVRCIFVQPQFNAKTAQVIAQELKGKVIPLDPLPKNYSEGMRTLARQLLNIGNSL